MHIILMLDSILIKYCATDSVPKLIKPIWQGRYNIFCKTNKMDKRPTFPVATFVSKVSAISHESELFLNEVKKALLNLFVT